MNRKSKQTVSQHEPLRSARLDAIGDPMRRAILDLLRTRSLSVAELADELPVSRPAVSQHLKVLLEAGLVRVEARGTRRIHSLDPDGTRTLQEYATSLWDAALSGFAEQVDNKERSR